MATFYASLVYAETQAPEDALLSGQASLESQQSPKRCVRLLEQSGLFQYTYTYSSCFSRNEERVRRTSMLPEPCAQLPGSRAILHEVLVESISSIVDYMAREVRIVSIVMISLIFVVVHFMVANDRFVKLMKEPLSEWLNFHWHHVLSRTSAWTDLAQNMDPARVQDMRVDRLGSRTCI